jgi:hypothetical protein
VPLGRGAVEIDGLLALEIDFLHPAYGSEDDALRDGLAYLRGLLAGS